MGLSYINESIIQKLCFVFSHWSFLVLYSPKQYIWNDYHTSIPTLPFELCYSIYIVQSTVKMEETKEDKTNKDMQAFQR